MWWSKIKEIKAWMSVLTDRLFRIDHNVEKILGYSQEMSEKYLDKEHVADCLIDIRDAFCPDDEYSSINRIHDKLNSLLSDEKRKSEVDLAIKTLDKFEDYMKNVDKLNSMVNEFKGCVSMARGALAERKKVASEEAETGKEKIS